MAVRVQFMEMDCQYCTDQQKKVRGCEEETGNILIAGKVQRRCPLKTIPSYICNYIQAYNYYQKGFLPNAGSWQDESEKVIQAFNIIENETHEIFEEKRKLKK